MFGTRVYNLIGGLLGYGLCPLALLSVVAPFAGYFPHSVGSISGWIFLIVAVLIVLCNIYLNCRRRVVDGSASQFPFVAGLAGAGSVAAFSGGGTWIPAMIFCCIADVIGQPVLSGIIASALRLNARNEE